MCVCVCVFKMYSPLNQFENNFVYLLDSTTLYTLGVVFLTLFMGITLSLINYQVLKPSLYQSGLEQWWSVVTGIVRQQLSTNQLFTPLMVYTFGSLVFLNLSGLIPYWFTVTSQLSVTLYLSLSFNLGFFYYGVYHHGVKFFGLFVPSGAPKILLPLIVVIEIVSYLIRPLSLSLRLFANMMAGHALVHILLGFVYLITSTLVLPLGVLAVFTVMLLEFGIALIQAYVFVVLCCIYLQDSLHPGH